MYDEYLDRLYCIIPNDASYGTLAWFVVYNSMIIICTYCTYWCRQLTTTSTTSQSTTVADTYYCNEDAMYDSVLFCTLASPFHGDLSLSLSPSSTQSRSLLNWLLDRAFIPLTLHILIIAMQQNHPNTLDISIFWWSYIVIYIYFQSVRSQFAFSVSHYIGSDFTGSPKVDRIVLICFFLYVNYHKRVN